MIIIANITTSINIPLVDDVHVLSLSPKVPKTEPPLNESLVNKLVDCIIYYIF